MGLIKKIFGGLFSIVGGIFSAIAKLLGLGKKDGYYMELQDDEESTPSLESPSAKVVTAAPANAASQNGGSPESEAPADSSQNGKAQSAKPASAKSKGNPDSVILNPDKPLVTANLSKAEDQTSEPAISNFATDYLVNPKVDLAPRRRPGPSLSPFKEMAKQVGKSPSMG